MYRSRVIPCLLIQDTGLYKTIRFKNPRYLGDPINTLRLFNDKEADELIILDIQASQEGKEPNFEYLRRLTGECFMPICYGGGITSLKHVEALFKIGIEKLSFNTSLFLNPQLINEAVKNFGSQSIVASIDVKKSLFGSYSVFVKSGSKDAKCDPVKYAKRAEELGVGEILLTSIDHDGMMNCYDLELIQKVSSAVDVPVIANGGAGVLSDCVKAVNKGASAAAAGSLFVYYGPLRAVLINYPTQEELFSIFKAVH
ncbi:MAG: AglZ/HisF2 family acetamidino modification protein [Syntrophomonas sp.]